MSRIGYVLGAAVLICLSSGFGGWAEDAGGGGGRRQWDPAQFQQRMLDRVKEDLAVTDEEWKALQPKVDAVQKLSMQLRAGTGMFGRRRGGGNQDAAQPKTDLEKKVQELQTLIENKDADPKAVKDKLKELRDLREKAKADLKKAQDELRELLTPRQEAQLVLAGWLD